MSEVKDEDIIDVEAAYSKTEDFINTNQKPLMYGGGAIVAVVVGVLYYFNMYLPPLEKEAQEQIFVAQNHFANDSFQLAMFGDNLDNMGFEQIIDDYSSTKVANTAKYYMGISLLRTGDFEGAIDYLSSYSAKDEMTAAIAKGAIGDAYSELGDYEQALKNYKAASETNTNDFTSPIYLFKAGKVAEKLGDYSTAINLYEKIKKNYPNSQEGRSIDKYLTRAKANKG